MAQVGNKEDHVDGLHEVVGMFESWFLKKKEGPSRAKKEKKHAKAKPASVVLAAEKREMRETLEFDELLRCVNDIEKQHLLRLSDQIAKLDRQKLNAELRHVVAMHLKEAGGTLVSKIKHIKKLKSRRRRRQKEKKYGKAKRYNARVSKKLVMKSRRKRLRRTAQW